MANTALAEAIRRVLIIAAGLVLLVPLGCESKEEASARRHLERLIEKLRSDDSEVSRQAATDLANMGPAAEGAVEALIEALSRSEEPVRQRAAYALGKIGPGAKDAIDPLEKLLEDVGPLTRVYAAQSLARIDPDAEPHLDVLLKALRHPNVVVRKEAAGAIEVIGRRAVAAVPDLTALLSDRELRRHAARALGGIGPGARAAIAPLERMARSGDPEAITAAQEALENIRK